MDFQTSKFEVLRSKSVWGQILVQIRPKFNDFLTIYEFVMIFSRMARCLVLVDPMFGPPPYVVIQFVYIFIYCFTFFMYSSYCQEWEIDQLLQFCRRNFIFLIFAWFFKAKYSTKICPS